MIRPHEIFGMALMVLSLVVRAAIPGSVEVGNPPDHSIEARGSWAWESKIPAMANIDIDCLIADTDLALLVDQVEIKPVETAKAVKVDAYKVAWESAVGTKDHKGCGKLFVYIEMDNCPHCPAALKAFEDAEGKTDGACVKLHVERDAKYVSEIAEEVVIDGKVQYPCPQVIAYRMVDGEWTRKAVVGAKVGEIASVMLGDTSEPKSSGLASVPAESLHQASADHCVNCKNCPAGSSGAHAAGACCGGCSWYVPFQPARNVLRLGKATAEAVRENWPTWPATGRPFGWRLRPKNWFGRCR